jgi:hypothetical protein
MPKKSIPMPDYMPTKEERAWHKYCLDNNIIISPLAAEKGLNCKKWKIAIAFYPNYKKINLTPTVYTEDNIWREYYLMCKYYYDKYRR